MNILIALPCLLKGGTEIQTLNLIYTLKRSGHKITTLCYFEYDKWIVQQYRNAESEVILLKWKRTISPFKFVLYLQKEIKCIAVDAIHVQYMAPGALPILAARIASVRKVLATVHQPYTVTHSIWERMTLRFVARLCTCFIVVSKNSEISWFGSGQLFNENLSLKNQPRHFTIYNAVDVKRIQKIQQNTDLTFEKRKLNIPYKAIVIGVVSRLRYEKGIDLLIDAFIMICSEIPHLYLLIVGTGADEEKLKMLVDKAGISSSVVFCGEVNWEAAMHKMALMDIVIVPSRFEGFGLSAVEAMSMGKPVIASDVFGLSEVVDNQCGLLFPSGCKKSLAYNIQQLCKDPKSRSIFGTYGMIKAYKNFDISIYYRQISKLYCEINTY